MPSYVSFPLETEPAALATNALADLAEAIPGYEPHNANFEVILVETLARIAAEVRDVASDVTVEIFKFAGRSMFGVLPLEARAAQATSTWTTIDNAGYTIPAGTLVGLRTTAGQLVPFRAGADTIIESGQTQTEQGQVTLLADEEGERHNGLSGAVILIDALGFVAEITLDDETNSGADAETDEIYLDRLVDEITLMAPRPILARDFEAFARRVAGVYRAVALDGVDPDSDPIVYLGVGAAATAASGNVTPALPAGLATSDLLLLTIHSADNVTSTLPAGWTKLAEANNGATVRTTVAWKIHTSGDSNPLVTHSAGSAVRARIAAFRGVNATDPIQAQSALQANASAQNIAAPALTADGMEVAVVVVGTKAGNWTSVATLPPSAGLTFAEIAEGADATTGIVWDYAIAETAMPTVSSTSFTVTGGTPGVSQAMMLALRPAEIVRNNERMVAVAAVDEEGNAVAASVKGEIDALLESLREVNFIVHVIDPTYTAIDVTFTAVTYPGYDAAAVEAAAELAVAEYLRPKNWGVPPNDDPGAWLHKTVVRYLEVAEVINRVSGVDYITALTVEGGASNVTLTGRIPLPEPGAISGTVGLP